MARYTKGPWKVDEHDEGCRLIQRQTSNEALAFTAGLADDAEDEANAHLIAAAPTLVEVCKILLSELEAQEYDAPIMKLVPNLKQIIAEAEGGP